MLSGLAILLAMAARAADVTGGLRLHTSGGWDDNVFESLEARSRQGDSFLMLLGDGHVALAGLPLGVNADLAFRGFTQVYGSYPKENRRQAEGQAELDFRGLGARGRSRLEFGAGGRQYPDSLSRDYQRKWGRLTTALGLGPRGSLKCRLDLWTLDFRSTAPLDQTGVGFDLSYEHPLRSWITAEEGLELGGVQYGIQSIEEVQTDLESPPTPELGPDRSDSYHLLHLGLRFLRGGMAQIRYAYRMQDSNSIDGAYDRHELQWLFSYGLPGGLMGQFYGNLESTRYTNPDLGQILILGSGEADARGDDNVVALRLSRTFGLHWSVDLRQAWYRNESLLIQNYYRKQVASAGVTWEVGSPSSF